MTFTGASPFGADDCRCVLCEPGAPPGGRHARHDTDPETAVPTELPDRGWTVAAVPADENVPGWAYTIGLWHSCRRAELAMFGLDAAVMRSCVDGLADLAASGRPIAAGDRFDDLVEDRPVQLRAVEPPWHPVFFGRAVGFYRSADVPFLQVVWPDRRALFPRQFGSGSYLRQRQPQLWRLPEEHPHDVWSARL
jgi:hypothetical protein